MDIRADLANESVSRQHGLFESVVEREFRRGTPWLPNMQEQEELLREKCKPFMDTLKLNKYRMDEVELYQIDPGPYNRYLLWPSSAVDDDPKKIPETYDDHPFFDFSVGASGGYAVGPPSTCTRCTEQ